mmetsp:Transcript_6408/g.20164  ORF Transcript_6408/g.20164 Transcript_6408/m.20164 type:complete len:553 (-) Transcript_6408:581-2239(-)
MSMRNQKIKSRHRKFPSVVSRRGARGLRQRLLPHHLGSDAGEGEGGDGGAHEDHEHRRVVDLGRQGEVALRNRQAVVGHHRVKDLAGALQRGTADRSLHGGLAAPADGHHGALPDVVVLARGDGEDRDDARGETDSDAREHLGEEVGGEDLAQVDDGAHHGEEHGHRDGVPKVRGVHAQELELLRVVRRLVAALADQRARDRAHHRHRDGAATRQVQLLGVRDDRHADDDDGGGGHLRDALHVLGRVRLRRQLRRLGDEGLEREVVQHAQDRAEDRPADDLQRAQQDVEPQRAVARVQRQLVHEVDVPHAGDHLGGRGRHHEHAGAAGKAEAVKLERQERRDDDSRGDNRGDGAVGERPVVVGVVEHGLGHEAVGDELHDGRQEGEGEEQQGHRLQLLRLDVQPGADEDHVKAKGEAPRADAFVDALGEVADGGDVVPHDGHPQHADQRRHAEQAREDAADDSGEEHGDDGIEIEAAQLHVVVREVGPQREPQRHEQRDAHEVPQHVDLQAPPAHREPQPGPALVPGPALRFVLLQRAQRWEVPRGTAVLEH